MPRSFPVALIFLLAASQAHAGCESAQSLRAKVRDCEGNLAYAAAGKTCLDDYDAAVGAAQVGIAKSLSAMLTADKQSAAMANAKKGYETAIATLAKLAEEGRRLGRQVEGYKTEIVFPEDFGASGAAGLGADTFLGNQACYRETRKLILSYAELLGLHAKELDLTRQIAAELGAKAFKGESRLKPEDVLPLLTSRTQGVSSPAGKPAQQNQSDITGTKKSDKAAPSH
jgi:hypothetical protein